MQTKKTGIPILYFLPWLSDKQLRENPNQAMKELNPTDAHLLPKSLNKEDSAGQMGLSGLQKLISFHVIGQIPQ